MFQNEKKTYFFRKIQLLLSIIYLFIITLTDHFRIPEFKLFKRNMPSLSSDTGFHLACERSTGLFLCLSIDKPANF